MRRIAWRLVVFALVGIPHIGMAADDPYLLSIDASQTERAPGFYPVKLDAGAARAGATLGKGLWIPLPDGGRVHFDYQRAETHPGGIWSFIGTMTGAGDTQPAVITFSSHGVYGTIPRPFAAPLSLTTVGGRVWLVDPAQTVRTSPSPKWEIDSTSSTAPHLSTSAGLAWSSMPAEAATASTSATVDVLVVYTIGFRTSLGSTDAALARINHLVDVVNQAYINSQVSARLRLVHAEEVPYPDNSSGSGALGDLTGTSPGGTPSTLAMVKPLRDKYGADVVVLFQTFGSAWWSCGGTKIIGANLTPITSADADKAFSVVNDNGGVECGDDRKLAEMLGINFGLVSDTDASDAGAYPFSHAYMVGKAFDLNSHGTLLANGAYSYWPVYSNPNIASCNNAPCGVAGVSDAARSLNLALPIIATFRPARPVADDVDADGKSDLLLHNPTELLVEYRLMSGTAVLSAQDLVSRPAGYRVVGSGDFNGDGHVDLIWTSAANDLYMWTGVGIGFQPAKFGVYPSGWNVVGAADVDGDGKADVLFHNPVTRQFSYRIMDGTTQLRAALISGVGAGYTVAAVGDFNGDGKADLVWTSSKNDLYMWIGNGASFKSVKFGTYPAGWKVVGAGDIDGDGRSDLLFYNASTHQFSYRIMSGTTQVRAALLGPVGAGYWVAAVGDYNGDGKADIIWTSSKNDLYMWTGNGSTFSSVHFSNYGAGWQVIGSK